MSEFIEKNLSHDIKRTPFVENAIDVTKQYGLKAAAIGFTMGSALMSQEFFLGADPMLFRHIAAPAVLLTGCVAGFLGYERTNNTCGMIGSAILTASFAGADGGGFSPVLCGVNSLGVAAMSVGSHIMPKQKKQREEDGEIKHIVQDGKTQTASSQVIGNTALLLGAVFGNKLDMIAPFACWTAGAVVKTTRAALIAKEKIERHAESVLKI